MKQPMPRTALVLGLSLMLTTGCMPDPLIDPQPDLIEAHAGLAHAVAPPVTGEPAFTWEFDDPAVPWGSCPPWMPAGCELAVIQGDPEQPNPF